MDKAAEASGVDGLSIAELNRLQERILKTKINVLMIGGTGVGKSSTISALLQEKKLEDNVVIGSGTEPETMDVHCYEVGELKIWDTPGLGDGSKDEAHKEKIRSLLVEKDDTGAALIDLVFVVLDGGSRDYSSAYELIDNVVLPNIEEKDKDRILIGINQADMALKGRHWTENGPDEKLFERLEELTNSVRKRMQDKTGLDLGIMYYSAGEIDEDGEQVKKPYNLQKLLSFILDKLPSKKRASFYAYTSNNKENFENNDEKEDYKGKVEDSVWESIKEVAKEVGGALLNGLKIALSDPKNIAQVFSFIGLTFFKKK